MGRISIGCAFAGLCVLLAGIASAQESLDTILERGHVRDWLVCGPFRSDMDGGIVASVRHGLSPFGARDFLNPIGGVSQARPESGLRVEHSEGYAIWSHRTVESPILDVSEAFLDRREGILYAAFTCESSYDRPVYLDLQAPVGVRAWVNGFPVDRDEAGALTGITRGIVRFRQGANRVIVQAALASLDPLDDAASQRRGGSLLTGRTGFEIALRMRPVQLIGDLAYIPRLDSGRSFTDDDGDLHKHGLLTFYNPTRRVSEPLTVTGEVLDGPPIPEQVVLPLQPGEQRVAELVLPTGERLPGQTLRVRLNLATKEHEATITTSLTLAPRADPGTVRVLTGSYASFQPDMDVAAVMDVFITALDRHLAFAESEPDYGFQLGDGRDWMAYLAARPANRGTVATLVDRLQGVPHAAYATLDERVVGGELLVRGLAYGERGAAAQLGVTGSTHVALSAPAFSSQTAQILHRSGIRGVVTDSMFPGEPGLFAMPSPDGSRIPVRRKRPIHPMETLDAFLNTADAQRTELLRWGIDTDLMLHYGDGPKAYLAGRIMQVRQGMHSVRFDAHGGDSFFRRVDEVVAREGLPFHESGRYLSTGIADSEIRRMVLVQGHGHAEAALQVAERMATQAALAGAEYPEAVLDHGWRQLMAWGTPHVFTHANDRMIYDALATYRHVLETANAIRQSAAAFLARQVGTRTRDQDGTAALVVFNPSGHRRTDKVVMAWPGEEAISMTLLDDKGRRVPYTVQPKAMEEPTRSIWFIAEDVPALGHRTFYIQSGGEPEPVKLLDGNRIQNEFIELVVDPAAGGTIAQLTHRDTGMVYDVKPLDDLVLLGSGDTELESEVDLSFTEARARLSDNEATVTMEGNEVFQRAVIRAPFAGGTVTRILTLYAGIPQVEVYQSVERITDSGLVMLENRPFNEGAVPVAGERYGAITRPSAHAGQAESNESLDLWPALDWVAIGPSDWLQFGRDAMVPLAPAVIDRGNTEDMDQAAAVLRDAWLGRGIPAVVYPTSGPARSAIWSDSTIFDDYRDELRHGLSMRIVLADDDRMQEVDRLLEQAPETTREAFFERRAHGTAFFVEDVGAFPDGASVPTLVVAGADANAVNQSARSLALSLVASGVSALPPALGGDMAVPVPSGGIAMLHAGTAYHRAGDEGALLTALFQSGDRPGYSMHDTPNIPPTQSGAFRYALYPYSETWRKSAVVEAAHAFREPFTGAVTGLRDGPLPPKYSWFSPNVPGFALTAFKPEGEPLIEGRTPEPITRRGVLIRGYESRGQSWEGGFTLGPRHYRAERRNPIGASPERIPSEGDAISMALEPWTIAAFSFQTPGRMRPGNQVERLIERPTHPVYVRYWQQNEWTAPEGGVPIGLSLEPLGGTGSRMRISIRNQTTNRSLAGRVRLTAGGGWSPAESEFEYDLQAGEQLDRDITVLGLAENEGGLMAETAVEGRRYFDVYERPAAAIAAWAERVDDDVVIRVENRGLLSLHGNVQLIGPPMNWPEHAHQGTIHPHRKSLSIASGDTARTVFFVRGEEPLWLAARIVLNGQTRYISVSEADS